VRFFLLRYRGGRFGDRDDGSTACAGPTLARRRDAVGYASEQALARRAPRELLEREP
jgi:hypothetical protein